MTRSNASLPMTLLMCSLLHCHPNSAPEVPDLPVLGTGPLDDHSLCLSSSQVPAGAAFAIESITPSRGISGQAQEVTLTGRGFQPGISAFLAAKALPVTWKSAESLVLHVPANQPLGAFDVKLVQPGESSCLWMKAGYRSSLPAFAYTKKDYSSGFAPTLFATGDLNKDGHVDYVMAHLSESDITLVPGDGQGGAYEPSFANSTYQDSSGKTKEYGGATALEMGDFNRDGTDDVAILQTNPIGLTVYISSAGKPQPRNAHPIEMTLKSQISDIGSAVSAIKLADFNQDGLLDIALLDLTHAYIDIRWGQGDGLFKQGPKVGIPESSQISTFTPYDVNSDGRIDLLWSDPATDQLYIAYNPSSAEANWEIKALAKVLPGSRKVLVADLEGSGQRSFITNSTVQNKIQIWQPQSDGTLALKKTLETALQPIDMAVGDINQDGLPDLAVTCLNMRSRTDSQPGKLNLFITTSAGALAERSEYETRLSPTQIEIKDLKKDGHPDIALLATGENRLQLFLQK